MTSYGKTPYPLRELTRYHVRMSHKVTFVSLTVSKPAIRESGAGVGKSAYTGQKGQDEKSSVLLTFDFLVHRSSSSSPEICGSSKAPTGWEGDNQKEPRSPRSKFRSARCYFL